jgi:hypothetical protein
MLSSTTKEAAAATVADAKNTAYSAKRDFNNATSDVKIDLNDVAAKAGRQVRGFIDSATDQFASASDAVVSEVRSNPVRSSAIALGVGLFKIKLISSNIINMNTPVSSRVSGIADSFMNGFMSPERR